MAPTRRSPTGSAFLIVVVSTGLAATGCGRKTQDEVDREKQDLASDLKSQCDREKQLLATSLSAAVADSALVKSQCDREKQLLATRHEADQRAAEADLSRCRAQQLALARACPGVSLEEGAPGVAAPAGAQAMRTHVEVSPSCREAAMPGTSGLWPPVAVPIRTLSEPYYSRFAERVVPVDLLADQVTRSTFDLEYRCVDERWYWTNPEFTFQEKVIFLGEETNADGTWWVLFTTRCAVDFSAPGRRDQVARTFDAEMVSRGLRITQRTSDESPPRVVFEQSFRWWGDVRGQLRVEYPDKENVDFALVYVAKTSEAGAALAREQNLGISAPSEYVGALARSVTSIFGIDFRLVSKVCHNLMLNKLAEYRKAKNVAGIVGLVLAGTVAIVTVYYASAIIPDVANFAKSVVPSLLRQFGITEPANVARRAIAEVRPRVVGVVKDLLWSRATTAPPTAAAATPVSDSATTSLVAPGGLFRTGSPLEYRPGVTGTSFGLLLVDLDDLPAPALDEINRVVASWTEDREVVASFFPKRAEDPGDAQAMLFVPSRRITLNYELVRNGLAKLRFEETDILERYPEMVSAAADALEDGVGWACVWSSDTEYVHHLEQAMKHLVQRRLITVRSPSPPPPPPQAPVQSILCLEPLLREIGPSACTDGTDNDDDEFVDCADQDCWPIEACAHGDSGHEATRPSEEAPTDALGGTAPGDAGTAPANADAAAS